MRLRFISISLLCFCFFAAAQTKTEKIDELISKYEAYKLFNGTVLVADASGVLFKKGYGYANMEWKIPNAPDVKFRIGSITKQFTAMLILQLVQEGKIKLDDKILDHLDYYRKDTGEKITIHQLLTHSSGIPSYTSNPEFLPVISRKFFKPDDFVKKYCMDELEFEPGSKFSYNNSGYFILGAIIEKITGSGYADNLQKRIFKPLGMKSSGYDLTESIIEKRAAGYQRNAGEYVNTAFLDMSLPYSAGSLYSTVEDLYLWDRALYTDKLLSNELKQKYFQPYIEARGGHYAYGWFIHKNNKYNENKEYTIIEHGGSINGFNSYLTRVIDDKKLVVLLNNTGGTVLDEIGNSIFNILYDLPYSEPKIPLALHLKEIIESSGIDEAVKEYELITKEKNDQYNSDENEINELGYYLLRNGDIKEALAVFKINVEAYPHSFNVYDSYGEALMKDGQTEKSIENYKKSLELNPRNTGAVAQLKQMGVNVEEKKDAVISPEILKSYEGKYQLAPDFFLTITANNNKIFAQGTGQSTAEIFPESETKFYVKVVNAQIEFEKGDDGKVKGLILYQEGQVIPAPKVE